MLKEERERVRGQLRVFTAALDPAALELGSVTAGLAADLETLWGNFRRLEAERDALRAFGRRAKVEIARLQKERDGLELGLSGLAASKVWPNL